MTKFEFTKQEVSHFKEVCYFSPEEERVLELKLRDYSICEIAMELKLSESTVNRRWKSVKKKIMKSL